METKKQVWTELNAALVTFEKMTNDGVTPMVETTKQRMRIETLLRKMDDLSEKVNS